MIIDGKKIADDMCAKLKKEFSKLESPAVLTVILVGDNAASKKFVELKERIAVDLGVEFRLNEYEPTIETAELINEVRRLNADRDVSGIVIQLPLPKSIDTESVLLSIDPSKDVDALSPDARLAAPVLVAVREIFKRHSINPLAGRTVVVGDGRLVGRPVAVALATEGVDVVVVNDKTKNVPSILKTASIVISGAGSPHFIKPEMLTQGVVLIDAGTSESKGKLAGDMDPVCAEVASLMTPVPGGVGPITVAALFQNLLRAVQG